MRHRVHDTVVLDCQVMEDTWRIVVVAAVEDRNSRMDKLEEKKTSMFIFLRMRINTYVVEDLIVEEQTVSHHRPVVAVAVEAEVVTKIDT